MGELGSRLYLDSGTLTPVLKKMESAGYVKRTRSQKDERIVNVFLTDKGRKKQEEARNIPLEMGSCLALGENEMAELKELLYLILEM